MESRDMVLFGTHAPAPAHRTLQAGQLSAVLQDGQLRRICWAGREAIRGISFLVRDRDWGTYPTLLTDLNVDESATGFKVTYTAQCQDDRQSLQYTAEITGDADGGLRFAARMVPTSDFSTSRAGFVVLHPLQGVAGEAVSVLHTDGTTADAVFPKHIAPTQPIFDIRALTHQVSAGVTVTCTMEGDAFEMEDQRNWSDASFKTYVRPLARPYPYILPAHQPQTQSVSLRFEHAASTALLVTQGVGDHTIAVGPVSGRVAALALTVLGDSATTTTSAAVQACLAALAPQWIVGRVSPESRKDDLRALAFAQKTCGAQLWLEVVVPCQIDIAAELLGLAQVVRDAGLVPAAVTIAPQALLKTVPCGYKVPGLEAGMTALFSAARRAFPGALIGGGSLAYFTELNCNPPPAPAIDFITHTTCPIIHAADDDSVMETLETLPWIFQSTLHLAGAAAYWLGSTAIGMRHNPYGAAPAPNPNHQRVAMAKEDPRQRGLFAAAFYVAYAAKAVQSGVAVLALCDPTGPFGLIATDSMVGQVFPAYHALRWLAQGGYKPLLAVDVNESAGVAALAFTNQEQRVLLIANTTGRVQNVTIAGVDRITLAVLDEKSCAAAMQSANWSDEPGVACDAKFALAPYAVARAILL